MKDQSNDRVTAAYFVTRCRLPPGTAEMRTADMLSFINDITKYGVNTKYDPYFV